jgi:hypothetical protein
MVKGNDLESLPFFELCGTSPVHSLWSKMYDVNIND